MDIPLLIAILAILAWTLLPQLDRYAEVEHGLDADGIAGEITLRVLNSQQAQPYRQEAPGPLPDTSPGVYISPAP